MWLWLRWSIMMCWAQEIWPLRVWKSTNRHHQRVGVLGTSLWIYPIFRRYQIIMNKSYFLSIRLYLFVYRHFIKTQRKRISVRSVPKRKSMHKFRIIVTCCLIMFIFMTKWVSLWNRIKEEKINWHHWVESFHLKIRSTV